MSTKTIKPTESELEILQVLWERNLASVREVHEELATLYRNLGDHARTQVHLAAVAGFMN